MKEINIKKRNLYPFIIVLLILVSLFLFSPSSNSVEQTIKSANYKSNQKVLDSYYLEINSGTYKFIENKNTNSLSYNNQIPGPLISGNVGDNLSIKVQNNLNVPTTVHWHGLQVENIQDGVPQVVQDPIMPQQEFTYELELRNPGLYWYHSHVDAHKQVESGLQGPLLISESDEDQGDILVLDDVLLDNSAQFYSFLAGRMHGRFGNILQVNGKTKPKIQLSNNPGRLRIVNTANARSFNLYFDGKAVEVIGKDIGKRKPYKTLYLQVHPGERYDLLLNIDEDIKLYHSSAQGNTELAELIHSKNKLNLEKSQGINLPFDVRGALDKEPDHYANLEGVGSHMSGIDWTINKRVFPNNPEAFESNEGDLVKIRIVNTQGQPHPMHLHGQKFIVLSRNNQTNENIGWEDTTMVGGWETVDIAFIAEEKGVWVFHCHILEHAEAGMLSILKVK